MMWSKFLQIFQDASGEMSSKRVFGGLGFLASLVMISPLPMVLEILDLLAPAGR